MKADPDTVWLARQAPAWLTPAGLAIAVLEAGVIIAQAALIAVAIHTAVDGGGTRLPSLLAGLLAVFMLRALVQAARDWLATEASIQCRRRLRMRLFDRVAAAGPLAPAAPGPGGLSHAMLEQVEALDGYFARYRPQQMAVTVMPAAILVAVAVHDWLAALLLLLTAPLIPLFMILVGLGAERLSRQQFQALSRLGGQFLDRLQGLITLRLFNAEQQTLSRLERAADDFRRRSMAVLRIAFLSSAVLEFFSAVAIATLAIYIGLGLLGHIGFGPAPALTLFSGLFILLLAPEFFQPLRALAQHYHDRANALGASTELRAVLALPPARTRITAAAAAADDDSGAALRLQAVSLDWPGRPGVLRDLSLTVMPGEHVAIVGTSGSGKSSLIHLLLGFVPPAAGRIYLDGRDLRTLDDDELAARVAWLGQRPQLFAGSIAANIAMGRPGATGEQIRQAAEHAGVTPYTARMQDGLDSILGERGSGLSIGQAQRVALARALLSPAPLLLLDEPTASLDAHNEQAVLSALDRIARNRTIVLATHRAAGMHWADRVLRLEQGRLEQGRLEPHA